MLTSRESAGQDRPGQCRENRGLGQSRRLCEIYKILRTTLRELAPRGAGAAWSGDGRWLYYYTFTSASRTSTCVEKMPIDGGPAVRVQCEAANLAVASDGSAIYYSPYVRPTLISSAWMGCCVRR
jgi:hypothetical protein